MSDKIYVAVISWIFLFVLLWCPLIFLLEELDMVAFDDNQNYRDPERMHDGVLFADFLNRIEEGKAALDNLYTNYLPGYDLMVQTMQDVETSAQMDFVAMLSRFQPARNIPETAETGGGNETAQEEAAPPPMPQFTSVYVGGETHRRFYAVQPYDFMESVMRLDEENLYINMRSQAAGINRLIQANTDVDFYLYIGTTLQDMPYFNQIIPSEPSTWDMLNEFMDSIEGAAGKDYFKMYTIYDRLATQWRTDHHWNSTGCHVAYTDIITMMRKNTPEIREPIEAKERKEYPGIQFRGSYAALSGYRRFYDDFWVYIYDLPNQGPPRYSMRSRADQYDAGHYDNYHNIFMLHYEHYYHTDRRRFVYENNTGRNLLIITDSLSHWTGWLIASSFDVTYLYFPWDGRTVDYNEYIRERGITDVLMLVYSQAGIFNVYGYCRYEQLQTE